MRGNQHPTGSGNATTLGLHPLTERASARVVTRPSRSIRDAKSEALRGAHHQPQVLTAGAIAATWPDTNATAHAGHMAAVVSVQLVSSTVQRAAAGELWLQPLPATGTDNRTWYAPAAVRDSGRRRGIRGQTTDLRHRAGTRSVRIGHPTPTTSRSTTDPRATRPGAPPNLSSLVFMNLSQRRPSGRFCFAGVAALH